MGSLAASGALGLAGFALGAPLVGCHGFAALTLLISGVIGVLQVVVPSTGQTGCSSGVTGVAVVAMAPGPRAALSPVPDTGRYSDAARPPARAIACSVSCWSRP
jgi:hypothetical protein